MVQNLVHNLCESLVENIDGVAGIGKKISPPPITYLTQWKIVGNSEVHTDPYLTSWKVSGNSVVDNNTILSCGDLGQDGMYHVKISNGVTVYDIPLDAPLRKVNDVADTIEFPSDTDGKALITRNFGLFSTTKLIASRIDNAGKICITKSLYTGGKRYDSVQYGNILCNKIDVVLPLANARNYSGECLALYVDLVMIRNGAIEQTIEAYQSYFDSLGATEMVYELATQTTELIDVSQFPVSPTDTYTSANVTPYSAFEHTEHSEIWSCGEYNAVDGKYHILVQPQGGSIADIALDEPLRKVNDVADTIEFPSGTEGKAIVTRNIASNILSNLSWIFSSYSTLILNNTLPIKPISSSSVISNILIEGFTTYSYSDLNANKYPYGCSFSGNNYLCLYDYSFYEGTNITQEFTNYISGKKIIYELATPTTELVDAPQIEEAESYSCVISQGGKAVSWSEFVANPT